MYDALGWLLLIVAGIFGTLLAFHVESNKPLSYKFTTVAVIIISLSIGYGIHFLLLAAGF